MGARRFNFFSSPVYMHYHLWLFARWREEDEKIKKSNETTNRRNNVSDWYRVSVSAIRIGQKLSKLTMRRHRNELQVLRFIKATTSIHMTFECHFTWLYYTVRALDVRRTISIVCCHTFCHSTALFGIVEFSSCEKMPDAHRHIPSKCCYLFFDIRIESNASVQRKLLLLSVVFRSLSLSCCRSRILLRSNYPPKHLLCLHRIRITDEIAVS